MKIREIIERAAEERGDWRVGGGGRWIVAGGGLTAPTCPLVAAAGGEGLEPEICPLPISQKKEDLIKCAADFPTNVLNTRRYYIVRKALLVGLGICAPDTVETSPYL